MIHQYKCLFLCVLCLHHDSYCIIQVKTSIWSKMTIVFKLFRGKSGISKFFSENFLANPQRMILLSFLIVILLGTGLLMIPSATIQPGAPTVIDALFTATSATCVTGLVVSETIRTYTLFGQIVILCLSPPMSPLTHGHTHAAAPPRQPSPRAHTNGISREFM